MDPAADVEPINTLYCHWIISYVFWILYHIPSHVFTSTCALSHGGLLYFEFVKNRGMEKKILVWKWVILLTPYLLTPWSRVLLEKLKGFQLVKKFPAFYGTRRFITAFTSARYFSLSWASSIQSIPPHPTSWRSILILPSHLRLGLQNGLFLQVSPTKHCIRLFSHPYALCAPPISFLSILWKWETLCSLNSHDYFFTSLTQL